MGGEQHLGLGRLFFLKTSRKKVTITTDIRRAENKYMLEDMSLRAVIK